MHSVLTQAFLVLPATYVDLYKDQRSLYKAPVNNQLHGKQLSHTMLCCSVIQISITANYISILLSLDNDISNKQQ